MLMFVAFFTSYLQQDLKDWTIDVLTDAVTRVEESVKSNS